MTLIRIPAAVVLVLAVLLGASAGLLPSREARAQVGPGGGDRILEIRVEGIQRVAPETVRSYMQIRAGDPFDPVRIDQSLKRLFQTGLFQDVSIRREGQILVVKVVENPIINRVAFEGNDYMEVEDLRKEVQLRSRRVYTQTRVRQDVQRIIDLYSRQGRFAVNVVPKVIQREQNRVDLIFEIDEGEPTLIRKITFIGNKAYSDRRLRSVIQSAETTFYTFLTADDVYDPDRVRFDEELLRRYYNSKGYADFRVLSTTAELSPNKEDFFITFTVDEGARYKTGEVKITSQLEGIDPDSVAHRLTIYEGDWYDSSEVERSVDRLTDEVNSRGVAFVDIRPQLDRDTKNRKVSVTFNIREGPRLFVERINIRGNVRTLDKVIRRELRLVEGDAFNRARYRRSEGRVRGLGYFKTTKFTRKQGSAPDKTVIDIEVEEQSTGSFSIGAGFSSTQGVLTQAQLVERNLVGTGQRLKLGVSVGSQTQTADFGFTEPYFLGRNMSAGFDLFRTKTDDTRTISFDREIIGMGLRLGFSYNDRLRQGLNYKLQSKEVIITNAADPDLSIFIKRQEGTAVTSSIGQSLTYDVRDSRIDTKEGYVISLSNDLAGFGGDNRYLRTELGGAIYYEVASDWILRLGANVGYIFGIGKDVRIDDRFFVGGDGGKQSLRGFAPGGIGPRDEATEDALGGNLYSTATAEVAVPIGQASSFQTKGFFFVDSGTLMFIDDDEAPGATVLDDQLIRVAAGVGVGVRTPFGVIRLNYAIPVVKTDFDEIESFSFRFGTSF